MKSSILLFDNKKKWAETLGADLKQDLLEIYKTVSQHTYSCVVINLSLLSKAELFELLSKIKEKSQDTQVLFILPNDIELNLTEITNRFTIFKILSPDQQDEETFIRSIQESLEEYNLREQNKSLYKILEEQNKKLAELSKDLEIRIESRKNSLFEAKESLSKTNRYYSSLVTALVAIQKADQVSEMESALVKCLSAPLKISLVKIFFESQSSLKDSLKNLKEYKVFESDLILDKRSLGSIIFARKSEQKFLKEEVQFLKQISDAISLALDRLVQKEKSDLLRNQWQSTFDAITEPVALVNSNFELIQYNNAFKDYTSEESRKKKTVYEQLFLTPPETLKPLGISFEMEMLETASGKEALFEVHSQKMKGFDADLFINIYRNRIQQKRAERQILESSKMAELGLIGGSIAHELNNPLAGLITFIQILKQEAEEDIKSLPASAQDPGPSLKEKTLKEGASEGAIPDLTLPKKLNPKTTSQESFGSKSLKKVLDSSEESMRVRNDFLNDLKEMEKSALKCKDIIQNLLSFSRKSNQKKSKIHLRDAINGALRVLRIKAKPLGIEIPFKIFIEEDQFHGAENQLTQSLVNILQNSLESVLEKRKLNKNFTPSIEVQLTGDTSHFYIDIIDNGIGLGKIDQIKIFTPFFTTKNSEQHRGLGLTISYQIVLDHSGDIELTSLFENKTRARVILPRLVFN